MAYEERGSVQGEQRLVGAEGDLDDQQLEASLRPGTLDDFVGQKRVRAQLSLVLEASKLRGRTADHVLLSGPPGLGKTTLAMIMTTITRRRMTEKKWTRRAWRTRTFSLLCNKLACHERRR